MKGWVGKQINNKGLSVRTVITHQATNFTKLSFKDMPALASKMLERVSPMKSVETTSSSVYPI